MKKAIIFFLMSFGASAMLTQAQTLDTAALSGYAPAVVREVFDVARYVKLDAAAQKALADKFMKEDSAFVAMVEADGGVLGVKAQRKLDKMHDAALAAVLSGEQLQQYYRGVFDAEANAEGIAIANKLQKQYDLTDQNWKFIRIAFYKIGLESRVIDKIMASEPAKAKKAKAKLRAEQLATIEEKGGIRVNDDMTVSVTRPFDPNALRKQ